ncbi:helix-turn-helix transcriptional regulator [Rhizorhabdus sp. FW153]|uniref:helix-turn-helix transcriptional regulator n=1 Tax=Rhizorhabdus sp. FW153 TaxID=3400216 RepID=UPI003CF5AFC4
MLQADLLATFYAAPTDRARLTPALDRVREMTNAASATLHLFQRSASRLRHQWQHACSQTPLSAHMLATLDDVNPRTLSVLNPPSNTPCLLEDSGLPERFRPELRKWQAQLRKQGMGRFIAARVSLDKDRDIGLALHARIDGSEMSPGTSELLVELMPHLRETVLLAAKVDSDALRHDSLNMAFERMQPGLVTISGDGEVLTINRSARRLLGLSDMATFLPPSLRTRIAAGGTGGSLCWKAGDRHLHICFNLLPHPDDAYVRIGGSDKIWLLVVCDVDERALPLGREFADCFGLTAAEMAVLGCLIRGADLAEVAKERTISIHTARTQLKSVLAKVGARRQSQLIRMVCNSPNAWLSSRT